MFSGSSSVKPGGTANFAIWLSVSGADVSGVTVNLTTSPTAATPHFTVCPSGHTRTCKLSKMANGQLFEFQAAVVVPKSSTNGQHVRLTAAVTITTPHASTKAWATVTVKVPATTPASSSTGTTPLIPQTSPGTLPGSLLPIVPGGVLSRTGGNVSPLLPSIPASTPSPAAQPAQPGATAAVANVGPLDRRLMGTQLIALAALCAAIGIVIARLTLRTPQPATAAANQAGAVAAKDSSQAADATAVADGSAAKNGSQARDGAAPANSAAPAGGTTPAEGTTPANGAAGDSGSPADNGAPARGGAPADNGSAASDGAAPSNGSAASDGAAPGDGAVVT